MNHYEEGINAMWEEVEGKKPEPVHIPSDEERWMEFLEEYAHSGYLVQSEFGAIDTTEDAMRDVAGGDIYRYLKTRNGKQISFGIREPYDITQIESYELPSDDDMIMQAVDQMMCEVCMFNEHCYMGMCIANKEWREEMRKTLFNAAKGNI